MVLCSFVYKMSGNAAKLPKHQNNNKQIQKIKMTARKRKVIDYKKLAGLVETDAVETSETCGLCGLSKRLTKSAINEVLDNGQTVNDFVSTFFDNNPTVLTLFTTDTSKKTIIMR